MRKQFSAKPGQAYPVKLRAGWLVGWQASRGANEHVCWGAASCLAAEWLGSGYSCSQQDSWMHRAMLPLLSLNYVEVIITCSVCGGAANAG